jgi:hypothetical protein
MMIAMVITFTATDTIGGVGGNTQEKQCTGSIQGQCTATQAEYIELPSSCLTQNSNLIPAVNQVAGSAYESPSSPGTGCSWTAGSPTCTAGTGTNTVTYVQCP